MAKEILIANSNKTDQEEFQRIFKTTDYRLIFSESGEEAILRVKLFKPDLIIAASGLPEKNGLELCEDIRADSESKHIPFILLSNILGEISERDYKRVQADGIISKPLDEDEVLHLVQRLIEEEAVREKEKGISEGAMEVRPFADIRRDNPGNKEDLPLDETEEDEIIELVDVVEEPESKMSIDDFVHLEKEESFGEAAPFESWDRIEEMIKPEERVSLRKFKPPVTGFKLSPEEEDEVETEEMLIQLEKEITPKETSGKEVEFFEKIELEEILEKVEQLKPAIEKEWPPEREWAPVKEAKAFEKPLPTREEIEEKYSGLEEFEAALKVEVKPGILKEEIQPLVIEEAKIGLPKEAVKEMKPEALKEEIQPFLAGELKIGVPKEVVTEEMLVEEMELEELSEEEFPEELLEEVLEEGEISPVKEPEAIRLEEIGLEEIRPEEAKVKPQEIWPEEISIGEMIPEEIRPKEIAAEEVTLEEAWPEEIKFEEIMPEEEKVKPREVWPEEVRIEEKIPEETGLKAIVPEEIMAEEARPQEVRIDRFQEAEAPRIFKEEIGPALRRVDRQVEEIIEKGVREMMEEFLTKLLPGMTENIIGLTLDRIERMVKEIVPDLAEKAIQEEIKRLQKGEKD
jgi:chemotaxis family two-component system response regulator PixH